MSESGELGFCPSRVSSKMVPFVGDLQPSNQGSMESEQLGVGKGIDHRGFSPGNDSSTIEGMHSAGEAFTSDSLNLFAMQCEAKEGCEIEGIELEARGALEYPQC